MGNGRQFLCKERCFMQKSIKQRSNVDLNQISLILAVIAFCAVQLSYVFGGLRWLDIFCYLLIPAFLLSFSKLIIDFKTESWDYRISFILLSVAIAVSLFFRLNIEIATIDDNYHVKKLVSFALSNDYGSQMRYFLDGDKTYEVRVFLFGFIESIWGLFYRYLRWDFFVVLLQAFPLFILWKQMMTFFRKNGVVQLSGIFSLAVILSLQVYWTQQGSGYIDSTLGVMAAVTLFLMHDLINRNCKKNIFTKVLALACVSSCALISKKTMLLIGGAGMLTAFWICIRNFKGFKFTVIGLVLCMGLAYTIIHVYNTWALTGNPLFPHPIVGVKDTIYGGEGFAASGFEGNWQTFYRANPLSVKIYEKGLNYKLLFVLSSWIMDYKYREWITPAPFVGGRGVLWSYLVLPVIFLMGLNALWRIGSFKFRFNPNWLFLFIFFIYIYCLDVSILARFMLGIDTFIFAFCLMWLWKRIEENKIVLISKLRFFLALAILAFAFGSYYCSVDGDILQEKYYKNTFMRHTYELYS